jgi:hypothetical protein
MIGRLIMYQVIAARRAHSVGTSRRLFHRRRIEAPVVELRAVGGPDGQVATGAELAGDLEGSKLGPMSEVGRLSLPMRDRPRHRPQSAGSMRSTAPSCSSVST